MVYGPPKIVTAVLHVLMLYSQLQYVDSFIGNLDYLLHHYNCAVLYIYTSTLTCSPLVTCSTHINLTGKCYMIIVVLSAQPQVSQEISIINSLYAIRLYGMTSQKLFDAILPYMARLLLYWLFSGVRLGCGLSN